MNKQYLEKLFSAERMQKYFAAHPGDETRAILHYRSNLEISEACYTCLSTVEVALRNAVNRELTLHFGVPNWYAHFSTTPGLNTLNKEISYAHHLITKRHEILTPSKVVAELTLGFWVRLFNAEYELILWKPLRRAFPFMPKHFRQRKHVSAPLNNFRNFRNRIFHNEPILWNINKLQAIHTELLLVMEWINKDLPVWIQPFDRFNTVLNDVRSKL